MQPRWNTQTDRLRLRLINQTDILISQFWPLLYNQHHPCLCIRDQLQRKCRGYNQSVVWCSPVMSDRSCVLYTEALSVVWEHIIQNQAKDEEDSASVFILYRTQLLSYLLLLFELHVFVDLWQQLVSHTPTETQKLWVTVCNFYIYCTLYIYQNIQSILEVERTAWHSPSNVIV